MPPIGSSDISLIVHNLDICGRAISSQCMKIKSINALIRRGENAAGNVKAIAGVDQSSVVGNSRLFKVKRPISESIKGHCNKNRDEIVFEIG